MNIEQQNNFFNISKETTNDTNSNIVSGEFSCHTILQQWQIAKEKANISMARRSIIIDAVQWYIHQHLRME